MRPTDISRELWENKPRLEKWTWFFSHPEIHYEYEDFITCVLSVEQDPMKSAKCLRKMYGILNARVHQYFSEKKIDSTSFREMKMKKLASCLDEMDLM